MEYGRYRVLSQLGQGGMASVYLGEDPLLQRLVAIKVIQTHLSHNTSLIERFNVEAKTVAALRHNNVVEIFDFGLQDNQQYIVMEYIDGQNLQLICSLLSAKPMDNVIAASIICQAAEGLSSAEKNGVVHRDIKPENLMFNSEGVLKIADFGIAHLGNEQSLTQTGAVLGSPNFMSPEQVEGLKPSHKTDLFSLGGVFYNCLTGKMPFTGPSIPVTMRNICEFDPPSIIGLNPDADPTLVALVQKLLQKKPEDRGEGARWLSNQLRAYLNQTSVFDLSGKTKTFIDSLGINANQTMMEAPSSHPSRPSIGLKSGIPGPFTSRGTSAQTGKSFLNLQTQPTTGTLGPSSRSPLVWVGAFLSLSILILAGVIIGNRFMGLNDKASKDASQASVVKALPSPDAGSSRFDKEPSNRADKAEENENSISVASSTPLLSNRPKASSPSSSPNLVNTIAPIKEASNPAPREISSRPNARPEPVARTNSESVESSRQPKRQEGPEASAGMAKIEIKSSPPFASVTINGKPVGETPMNKFVEVPAGRVHIEVVHRLHPPFDTTITAQAGRELNFKFRLDR